MSRVWRTGQWPKNNPAVFEMANASSRSLSPSLDFRE
ncbi:hypothetical protein FOQG_18736 [Fusarium oxysporum f. sp. raphani 54005]|uniref:Uncharacterized protein n=2 Tax=Fusarium oxysporum TaxID=5507 RepID=X0BCH3_FUSOX|nr:hypothetical protein FOQG_18736 [Fusarium oxysporum f. sp. raphani 54005]EXM12968.1 hypothetical protein FOTG_18567 [Fusarium oxysporum f. sp. vasinfectum 25433]